jgi:hypothetical protein
VLFRECYVNCNVLVSGIDVWWGGVAVMVGSGRRSVVQEKRVSSCSRGRSTSIWFKLVV